MSYTFSYTENGIINEYTVTNNDITWNELLEHFENFLRGCGFHFQEGFVGFEAKYQQQDDNPDQLEFQFYSKKEAYKA
jgi:hypothetical protein